MKHMKYFFCLCLFTILITGFRPSTSPYEDRMSSFKWLIGTWVCNTAEGKIMETWLPMSDSMLTGQSTMYKKTTETVPLESIQLICRNKQYYFVPLVQGENNNKPVEFKITSYNKNGFVAENPTHDFPQKISYTLYKKDSLHAIVAGNGKHKDYYYARVTKTAPPKAPKKN